MQFVTAYSAEGSLPFPAFEWPIWFRGSRVVAQFVCCHKPHPGGRFDGLISPIRRNRAIRQSWA